MKADSTYPVGTVRIDPGLQCQASVAARPLPAGSGFEAFSDYNQKVRFIALAAVAFGLLSACSRNINNKEAVRQGVIDYLNQRSAQTGLDMKLIDVDVASVQFQNNDARAAVSFNAKGSPGGGMLMNYTLERHGNKWVVKGRAESGMNPHGAQGMPAPEGQSLQPLPPGHQSQPLPPGHPPVGGAAPPQAK